MKVYDIIGFAYDGEVYCLQDAPHEARVHGNAYTVGDAAEANDCGNTPCCGTCHEPLLEEF